MQHKHPEGRFIDLSNPPKPPTPPELPAEHDSASKAPRKSVSDEDDDGPIPGEVVGAPA